MELSEIVAQCQEWTETLEALSNVLNGICNNNFFFFSFQGNISSQCCLTNESSGLLKLLGTFLERNSTLSSIDTDSRLLKISQYIYVFLTPLILSLGIIGNILSLSVFLSKKLRHLSASHYLIALSIADTTALIFYVCIDWLKRGLSMWPNDSYIYLFHTEGFCQLFIYLGYSSRFLSAWLVVAFTVERYIAVCHPFQRYKYYTRRSTRRILLLVVIWSLIFNLHKPILSGIHEATKGGPKICTVHPNFNIISFILDNIFAFFITLVPFTVITVLNSLIIRCLLRRNRKRNHNTVITEENVIRLEFTLILLVISFFFIALNLPFFVVWCIQFSKAVLITNVDFIKMAVDFEFLKSVLFITRTIFYMNYCVNFFLYSFTGAYFRRELSALFICKRKTLNRRSSRSVRTTAVSCRSMQSSWV